jgi:hypothetical protein
MFAIQFFQFCIVRTGLVHLSYYRLALALAQTPASGLSAEDQATLLQQALAQIHVHSTTLMQGQVEGVKAGAAAGGLLPNGLTYWYRAWLLASNGF